MSNDHKKATAKISKKRSFSRLSCCFAGSPVLDDDGPARPAPPVGSKRKPSQWFPWARSRKKLKSIVPAKTPAATFPAKSRTTPAAPKSSSTENSGPVTTLELKQTNMPLAATNRGSGTPSTGSSFNSVQFQTKSRTSVPETPQPIARSDAGAGPNSTALARGGTLAPVVGLWIMVAILAIMVFAGLATAVVCFCSCLYLWPQSSPAAAAVATDSASFREDLDSKEHKKRVILEGLLERNGRRSSLTAASGRR